MLVKDITHIIESFAPLVYQENYDNSGLQVGNPMNEVTGILLSLDVTDLIIHEAIERNCNMIVAHHPLIFSGIKRLSGNGYVERAIQLAIKNDINIYAAHTNLDNIGGGVNATIAQKLGLQSLKVLSKSKDSLNKLYTYVPIEAADRVRSALFAAGAGSVGQYTECSFNASGTGTFKPGLDTRPAIGIAGGIREEVSEVKLEVLVPRHLENKVLDALKTAHPYEEVAYELIRLQNLNQDIGAGLVGSLPEPMDTTAFLNFLKKTMNTGCIRHTGLFSNNIRRVAICGGSGSFLLKDAIAAGADMFITADFKYHQFFDAEGKIVIADIGHYESEQFTPEIFEKLIKKKFPNFAILLSNLSTNPVKYFC